VSVGGGVGVGGARVTLYPTQTTTTLPTPTGGFLGPYVLGAMRQQSGRYGPSLGLLGACLAAAAVMVFALSESWAHGGPWFSSGDGGTRQQQLVGRVSRLLGRGAVAPTAVPHQQQQSAAQQQSTRERTFQRGLQP